MTRSGRVFGGRSTGQKIAALLLLGAVFSLGVGFSSPHYFSASAAGWIDQIFGNMKVHRQPRYRQRQQRRKVFAIGRIDRQLKTKKKKRRLYRVPKSSTNIYSKSSRTYRTMCVRTCDGFFFPVSFSTTKGHLKKDEKVCKTSCGGAKAQLYYYPNPGGEIEDMVSYRGKKKYKKLKYAFLYKTKFVSSCRCKPEPWTQAAKQQHKKYASVEQAKVRKLALRKKARKKRTAKRRAKNRSKGRRYSRKARTVGLRSTARRKSTKRRYKVKRARRTKNWKF